MLLETSPKMLNLLLKKVANTVMEKIRNLRKIALIKEIKKIKKENWTLENEMKLIHFENDNLKHCLNSQEVELDKINKDAFECLHSSIS